MAEKLAYFVVSVELPAASQSLTVLSRLVVAMRRPSGLQATLCTKSWWGTSLPWIAVNNQPPDCLICQQVIMDAEHGNEHQHQIDPASHSESQRECPRSVDYGGKRGDQKNR